MQRRLCEMSEARRSITEAKWNLFEPLARSNLFGQMPAIDISGCCIPAECDNIKLSYNGEIASRWDAYLLCDICRHFASAMLHFASLITHNLRCIPAYAHQIPTGFFQSLLNYHRNNLYIISYYIYQNGQNRMKRTIAFWQYSKF